MHRAAVAVAGDRVYLVPPAVIGELGERLTSTWESIRVRTSPLGSAEARPVIAQILRARLALPSQWLPALTARRVEVERVRHSPVNLVYLAVTARQLAVDCFVTCSLVPARPESGKLPC